MISNDTAVRILRAYREIEAAKTFLKAIEVAMEKWEDWGDRKHMERDNSPRFCEMGVPMHGVIEDASRTTMHLYAVKPRLALSVIRAHIADQEREIIDANEQAWIELGEKG